MDDKTKKKSDKLTKQSFALLDRIRQRKQKQKEMAMPPQENYIEDLYLKVFGKCSPHFNKMETSNDIVTYVRGKQKESRDKEIELEFIKKECGELRQQVTRLKESKDDMGKVKTLNEEMAILEGKMAGLNQEIKMLRISKDENEQMTRKIRQECESLKASNRQLQDLVEQLSAQLQNLANQETIPEQQPSMLRSLSEQVDSLKVQLQQSKSQSQQQVRDKAQMMEKIVRLERELQLKTTELINAETSFKQKLQNLISDVKQLTENNNSLKLTLAEKQSQRNAVPDYSQQLEVAKKDLQRVIQELTALKVEKDKKESEQADELLKYQNETFSYLEMIRELNKNGQVRQGQLYTQIKELQSQVKELKEQVKDLSEHNKNLTQQKQQQGERHRSQMQKKEQLFQKVFSTKNELDKVVKSKEAEIVELKKQIITLEQKTAASVVPVVSNSTEQDPSTKEKDAQISELKLKVLTLEKKNESLQQWKPCPPIEDSMYLDSPDKIRNQYTEKINKHMDTIKELNQQLTEAYSTIEAKDRKIKQLEKGKQELKKSPEKEKERGRSVKRLAGMFGF